MKLSYRGRRNAVYNGPLNKLCLELSENEKFRRMWGIPLDPKPEEKDADEEVDEAIDESTRSGTHMFEKMEDVELVLRFFAYRKIGEFKAGLNKISEFLDQFIVAGNKFPADGLAEYRSMFEATVDFLWDVLETEAFTVLDPSKRRPTKIVYDPLMFAANRPDVVPHRPKLVAKKTVLRGELKAMYEKNQALFSGRRTNFKDTQDRNLCVSDAFASAITKPEILNATEPPVRSTLDELTKELEELGALVASITQTLAAGRRTRLSGVTYGSAADCSAFRAVALYSSFEKFIRPRQHSPSSSLVASNIASCRRSS